MRTLDVRGLLAVGASVLLGIGQAPFLPQHEYEARYLLLAFANEVPMEAYEIAAFDASSGEQALWYGYELRGTGDVLSTDRSPGELAVGPWGPSRGYHPLLPNGFPAPDLQERAVTVRGDLFVVRIWEGEGLQKDCLSLFGSLGLTVQRTTGGPQAWSTSDTGTSLGQWDKTQYLTCAWIRYIGPQGGPSILDSGTAVLVE